MQDLKFVEIFKVIDEQRVFQFSGNLNLVQKESNQHLGKIVMMNGDIVSAQYKNRNGLKAFYHLVLDSALNKNIHCLIEPELIANPVRDIHYPFSVLEKKTRTVFTQSMEGLKNKPPEKLRLKVKTDIFKEDISLNAEEFEVASTIVDFSLIKDIYKECNLLPFEITNSLVSLRKKRVISVHK